MFSIVFFDIYQFFSMIPHGEQHPILLNEMIKMYKNGGRPRTQKSARTDA
jgi:hypothetical protein